MSCVYFMKSDVIKQNRSKSAKCSYSSRRVCDWECRAESESTQCEDGGRHDRSSACRVDGTRTPGRSCWGLTLRKIAYWMSKNCQKLTFFLNWQKLSFFQQNCQWQFCWKIWQFLSIFFEKNVKILAIFWQSNGNFPDGQH